jgi:multicomponent Na+:H+ antiporter subunit D
MADIQEVLRAKELFGSESVFVGFLLIMVGVFIKMAFFPLYGWLPNAYSFSASTTACLIAPLMTKVSVYIMIRMILTVFSPEYAFGQLWSPGVVRLAVVAILAGSILALAQADLKKMLCYLIVAEVGYMVGGVWLANHHGMVGAIYHIVSDAFMTLCLFLAAGILFRNMRGHSLASLDGMFRRMPWTMAGFTVGAFSMIGVPPTCGFFSKWYLVRGGIESGHWDYVVALIVSSLVNAVLFFRIIEVAYFGKLPDPDGMDDGHHRMHDAEHEGIREAPPAMLIPLLAAAAALVLIGIFNAELVELIEASLEPFGIVGGGGKG